MKRAAVVIVLFLSVPLFSTEGHTGEDGGGGLLYGKTFAYMISAPAGWIFDSESGVKQGVTAVIYPNGHDWTSAPAVIYSLGTEKGKGQTMDDIIKKDLDRFKANNQTITMRDVETAELKEGKKAVIKRFEGDQWGNKELVAYINTPKAVVTIVLSARDIKNFESSIDAFKKVVNSFKFVTDDITIK